MTDYDVIIAGAGTGGAITAYTLAKRGHSVLLIDRKKRDKIGEKTCGDALGSHHIRNLNELIGLPEPPKDVIKHNVNGIDLIAPDRNHRLRMAGPTTTGFSFDRLKMGQWLLNLADSAGASVQAATRVKRLIFKDEKVAGIRVSQEGVEKDRDITSKIVVDATGATGVLRRQLPDTSPIDRVIEKHDLMVAWRDIYNTPHYEFEQPDILEIYWDQEQTLGGYTWVFPQGPHKVNVGLGIMTLPGHRNPHDIFDNFVKTNWDFMNTKLIVEDSSGGIAPIRRPIDTMVDNNFILVGDSACQVNPVHGGGIGSSMLGGAYAAITASEALEANNTSIQALWPYNPRYMQAYGMKQASLDVFRWYLLKVTNDDINFAFRKGIIKGTDLLSVSITGKMVIGKGEKIRRLISGFGNLSLLRRVQKVAKLMDDIKDVYANYPASPEGLAKWKKRLTPIYNAVKAI